MTEILPAGATTISYMPMLRRRPGGVPSVPSRASCQETQILARTRRHAIEGRTAIGRDDGPRPAPQAGVTATTTKEKR
jgi:hypothetical protein